MIKETQELVKKMKNERVRFLETHGLRAFFEECMVWNEMIQKEADEACVLLPVPKHMKKH